MLDNKKRAMLDQATAEMSETLPPLWWAMYRSSVQQGFSGDQAMAILLTVIKSMLTMKPG